MAALAPGTKGSDDAGQPDQLVVSPEPRLPLLLTILGFGHIDNIPNAGVMMPEFFCKHTGFLCGRIY